MGLISIPSLIVIATSYLPVSVFAVALPPRSASSWQSRPIELKSCGTEVPKTVNCATRAVPLNWADPNGDTIDLALNRLRADNSSAENLLINPGGPGGSATGYILAIAAGDYPVANALIKSYNLSKSK